MGSLILKSVTPPLKILRNRIMALKLFIAVSQGKNIYFPINYEKDPKLQANPRKKNYVITYYYYMRIKQLPNPQSLQH